MQRELKNRELYSVLTFVLLIETWGENSIFLLLHVELLRMWAKTSHMQAAFISFYIKCSWFMSPQCLFPAWNKLWRWIPPQWKKGGGDERLRGRQRDSEPQGVHRESSREVLDPKWHHLPSLRCVSALQVLITSYEYGKRRSAQLLNSFTVCLPVLSWEINRESGYSLNIYKNKLWWILSRNTVHVMKTLHVFSWHPHPHQLSAPSSFDSLCALLETIMLPMLSDFWFV